jgi:hypothetical protein
MGRTDLVEGNLRLGFERNLVGNLGLLASLGIIDPSLRKVQTPGDRQAGRVVGDR